MHPYRSTPIIIVMLLLLTATTLYASYLKHIYITSPQARILAVDYEDSPTITELPFGTRLEILGRSEEWYKIKIDSIVGYISQYDVQRLPQMSLQMRRKLAKAIQADAPMIEMDEGGDTVSINDSVTVYALVSDGLGEVGKILWKIGAGPFIETNTSHQMIIIPATTDTILPIIVKVLDNDNISSQDTTYFIIRQPNKTTVDKDTPSDSSLKLP